MGFSSQSPSPFLNMLYIGVSNVVHTSISWCNSMIIKILKLFTPLLYLLMLSTTKESKLIGEGRERERERERETERGKRRERERERERERNRERKERERETERGKRERERERQVLDNIIATWLVLVYMSHEGTLRKSDIIC